MVASEQPLHQTIVLPVVGILFDVLIIAVIFGYICARVSS